MQILLLKKNSLAINRRQESMMKTFDRIACNLY